MSILPYLDHWISNHTTYSTYQTWFEGLAHRDLFKGGDTNLNLGFFCMDDQVEFE